MSTLANSATDFLTDLLFGRVNAPGLPVASDAELEALRKKCRDGMFWN